MVLHEDTSPKRLEHLTRLLERTYAAHHEAFAAVGGADPEWAHWYADYIKQDLPSLKIRPPSLKILADTLRQLEEDQQDQLAETPWPVFYAQEIIKRFGQ
jgi:hypothetical protein